MSRGLYCPFTWRFLMNNLAKSCGILGLVFLTSCGMRGEPGETAHEQITTSPGAEIVGCGEVEGAVSTRTVEAPDTALGYVNVMPELETPAFKPGCPNIEAKLGTRFGVRVVARGAAGSIVPLVTRVTHPEIRNPENAQTTTVDQWSSPMNSGIPRYAGWSFDKPWELVAGRWRIEILDAANKVLAAQDFSVTVK